MENREILRNQLARKYDKHDKEIIEARKKSEILEKHKEIYHNNVSYNSGNCWINKKISNSLELDDTDKNIYSSIINAQELVGNLSYPINLFHGFEKYTMYKDKQWQIGDIIPFQHALSKTPSFTIANTFAKDYNWPGSLFWSKYLFVKYPEGSKHICIDIRLRYDEYEYLRANENLKLVDICYALELSTLNLHKFYVFDSEF